MTVRTESTRRGVKRLSTVPKEMYERVLDLALGIANSRLGGDDRGARGYYRRLCFYCREQESLGRRHPFLLETIADFSRSRATAIKLYHSALRLSRRMGEPQHTILLSLGRLHLEHGNRRAARRCLRAAEREASSHQDRDDAAEARALLESYSGPNVPLKRAVALCGARREPTSGVGRRRGGR